MPPARVSGTVGGVTRFRIVYFVFFSTYAVVIPYFQLLLRELGFSPSEIGLLLGAFELAGIVGPFAFGVVADRTGRFRLVILAATLLTLAAFTPLLTRPPLVLAVAFTAMMGFGFKTNVPMLDALAGATLPNPVHDYGRVRLWGSVSFVLVVLLLERIGLIDATSAPSIARNTIVVIALFAVATILLPAGSAEARVPSSGAIRDAATSVSPWLYVTVVILFIQNFGFAAYTSFFSLYLVADVGVTAVGVFWALGAVGEIPIILFSGRIIDRFGPVTMLRWAALSMIIRLVVYAAAPSLPFLIPVQLLHAVSFGIMHTGAVALVRRLTGPGRRAYGQALYSGVGMGLSLVAGSAVGGAIADASGYRTMYAWAIVPVAIALVLFAFLGGSIRRAAHVAS
jgi:PPP family 3-phenylpropionic acid transporter